MSENQTSKAPNGQGSPGSLTPVGLPNIQAYGVPTAQQFIPQKEKKESRSQDVREIYRDLVSQGMHPKDAAKQAQDQTGHSVVTGQPIKHQIKFSKKSGKVIGQFGTSSGKAASGRFGQFGR